MQKTYLFPLPIGIMLAIRFPAFQDKTWPIFAADLPFLFSDEHPAYLLFLVMNHRLAKTWKDETAEYPIDTFQHHLPAKFLFAKEIGKFFALTMWNILSSITERCHSIK